jgi:hypothetical protein
MERMLLLARFGPEFVAVYGSSVPEAHLLWANPSQARRTGATHKPHFWDPAAKAAIPALTPFRMTMNWQRLRSTEGLLGVNSASPAMSAQGRL